MNRSYFRSPGACSTKAKRTLLTRTFEPKTQTPSCVGSLRVFDSQGTHKKLRFLEAARYCTLGLQIARSRSNVRTSQPKVGIIHVVSFMYLES